MNKIIALIKIIINIVLFVLYSAFGIIFGNFLYGFYVKHILQQQVPGPQDEVHYKLAIIFVIAVLLLTFLFRKFLYFAVFTERFLQKEYEKKSSKKVTSTTSESYTEVTKLKRDLEEKERKIQQMEVEMRNSRKTEPVTKVETKTQVVEKIVVKEKGNDMKFNDSDNDLEIYVNKEI